MITASRRVFLGRLGNGMLLACFGPELASALGMTSTTRDAPPPRLPADLEQLVRTMQDSAPADLMVKLTRELDGGTALSTLVAAGAIANARTFGGEDYEGYHAQMALLPALHMARQMSGRLAAMPVLKVLYRNTARIQVAGDGRERLQPVAADATTEDARRQLRERMLAGDMTAAEKLFAGMCERDLDSAYDDLEALVRDDFDVHRITLAWRAWDMLPLVGEQYAHTMLRQCVRYCVDHEQQRTKKNAPEPTIRQTLPKALDRHQLLEREAGSRQPDDKALDELTTIVFGQSRERAADAVAAALAEGFAPDAVAEAITLAGNRLLLHDTGENRVHGASVGVHASDAANAWRNVARFGPKPTRFANLVAAAYHTAGQSQRVGVEPYAFDEQLQELNSDEPTALLQSLRTAIEARDQRAACAAAFRYGQLDLSSEPIFETLLGYAISQDGALHAEKYYHTAHEEFGRTRATRRWRHVVALARVTASEYGEPAPGHDLTRRLLES